eukprot:GGOE01013588.1.p1 GENE.GGOE01013588.1~~GGOE01013588.1.p1  ORF type:complete len:189 (-),score=30.07 GGOE01013588.1:173-718(-)
MRRAFAFSCQRAASRIRHSSQKSEDDKKGSTKPEGEMQSSLKNLEWEAMARDSAKDWINAWHEDEGFEEGWLPNEWDEADDEWHSSLESGGKIPGGPSGSAIQKYLKELQMKSMLQDAAAIVKGIIKDTPSSDLDGHNDVLLRLLDKLHQGRDDFNADEQAVFVQLLKNGEGNDLSAHGRV